MEKFLISYHLKAQYYQIEIVFFQKVSHFGQTDAEK